MNDEREIIKKITGLLPKSKFLQNNFFESDSEILKHNNKNLLFSTDEFSQEDFFSDDDPFILGKNVAIATISDILASGGSPLFYAHSLTIRKKWDTSFIEEFSKGISMALNVANVGFIGGDTGVSETWKYTGIVLGETNKPITRIGTTVGDLIYMTGKVGIGNLEAAKYLSFEDVLDQANIKLPRLELNLRLKESELINKYATSCIDSSDGVLNAINTIVDLNKVGFQITYLPYSEEIIQLSKIITQPKCLFFMGECGEYELVFTINPEHEEEFIKEANNNQLIFNQIGRITVENQKILETTDETIDFLNFKLSARGYHEIGDYLTELINYAKANRK